MQTKKWIIQSTAKSKKRRAEAVAELCQLFEPLVKAQALKYRQGVIDAGREELEQVARVGLLEAIHSFDISRWKNGEDGVERLFARHAVWGVRHSLAEYVRSLGNPVRLPGVVMDKLPRLRREQSRLAHQLMREPTCDELAEAIKLPVKTVAVALQYLCGAVGFDPRLDYTVSASDAETKPIHASVLWAMSADVPSPEDILIALEEAKELRRQRRE